MAIETNEGTGAGGAPGAGTEDVPPTGGARMGTTGERVGAGTPPATPPPVLTRSAAAAAAMPPEQLSARLARERSSAEKKWADGLGFKSVDEAKEYVAKAREREAADNERKFAELSEVERAKVVLAEKDARIAQLEAERDEASNTVLIERQERLIGGIASEFVKPKALAYANFCFKRWLKEEKTDEDVEKMRDADVKKFFRDFVKDNPEHAITAGDTPAEKKPAAAGAVVRRPITTGAPPARRDPARPAPPAGGAVEGGKTAKPNQKNSMNPAEVRAFAAKHGIDYPGPGGARLNGRR